MPLRRERKNRKKRSASATRLRVEALDCKEVTKKMPLRRERKNRKKKKCLSYAFACRGTRLAEMERFELSSSFPSYTISNRAPSTGLGDISE